jgi:hypothetical protein
MPADHGVGLHDHQCLLPSRPQTDERNPEGSIEQRQPRPTLALSVDLELLAERKLDERLIPATSEESQEATEDRECESRCGPHRGSILMGWPAAAED